MLKAKPKRTAPGQLEIAPPARAARRPGSVRREPGGGESRDDPIALLL
nr:MAG TPA: hypothetical protein [Bacteriophage sp.]